MHKPLPPAFLPHATWCHGCVYNYYLKLCSVVFWRRAENSQMVTNYWLHINCLAAVRVWDHLSSTLSQNENSTIRRALISFVCFRVRVFPQGSAPSSVPGPTVARSSPGRTSWPATTARTRARSASTARCATSASWGATTWLNTPGGTRASSPACCRAPAQPRDAAAPRRCHPPTPETGAPPGCEAHPSYCTYKQKGTCNEAA